MDRPEAEEPADAAWPADADGVTGLGNADIPIAQAHRHRCQDPAEVQIAPRTTTKPVRATKIRSDRLHSVG
ncbi:hypothetical protein GCM10027028_17890 [Streptomyces sundarbansensis]